MDKLEIYRKIVQELLTGYGSYKPQFPDIERQTIFDTERDHYQIVNLGWHGTDRTYGSTIHIDIKNDKIWIQQNMTEIDLAQELVEKGVAKKDIVLGFLSPSMRKYSDFAVV